MVVDPYNFIVSNVGQILHSARFSSRSWSLKDDGIVTHCDNSRKLFKQPLKRLCSDKVPLIEHFVLELSFRNDELLHEHVLVREL